MNYIRPHIPAIAVILLMHVIGAAIQLELIEVTLPLINEGVKKHDMDVVAFLGTLMLVLVAVFAIDRLIVSFLSSRITGKMIKEVRRDLYASLLRADESGRSNLAEGSIMTTVTSDVSAIEDYLMAILGTHMFLPILMAGLVMRTLALDARFGLTMLGVFIGISVFVIVAGKRILPAYRRQQECLDRVNDILKENITGVRVIRAEGKVEQQIDKFGEANDAYGASNRAVNLSTHFMQPMATTVMNVTVVLVCALFAMESNPELLGTGIILILFQYVTYFLMCASMVPFFSVVIPRMIPLRKRISRIMTMAESNPEVEGMEHPDADADVMFSMEGVTIVRGTETKAIGLDMSVRKGEMVAVVGDNVSGKDGIATTILGFSGISEGRMTVGGHDISVMSKSDVREFVSYVADRAQMFRDTFRHNIDPYGRCDDDRMERALDASRFRDVVDISPEGLDTMVTNEGNSISSGQRQKLAIARCLAKQSSLYIFDRCFYSLDTESKLSVIKGIREMAAGSTVMVITSDIHLVRDFDRIYVMHDGRMVASGDDSHLSEGCAVYRALQSDEGEGP